MDLAGKSVAGEPLSPNSHLYGYRPSFTFATRIDCWDHICLQIRWPPWSEFGLILIEPSRPHQAKSSSSTTLSFHDHLVGTRGGVSTKVSITDCGLIARKSRRWGDTVFGVLCTETPIRRFKETTDGEQTGLFCFRGLMSKSGGVPIVKRATRTLRGIFMSVLLLIPEY